MNGIPVLVVDDHQRFRELFCELLTECFPQVELTTAADGSEALRLTSQIPFALVVLDYQLPWINGGDVVRQLRARCQHQRTAMPPIVLISTDPNGARFARMMGANAFLPKPTTAAEIRTTIGPLLAQVSLAAPPA